MVDKVKEELKNSKKKLINTKDIFDKYEITHKSHIVDIKNRFMMHEANLSNTINLYGINKKEKKNLSSQIEILRNNLKDIEQLEQNLQYFNLEDRVSIVKELSTVDNSLREISKRNIWIITTVITCIIGIIGFIIGEFNLGGKSSDDSNNLNHIQNKNILEYKPKINDISDEKFNSENQYYVQMITVETEKKAKRLTEIASESFKNAKYYKTEKNQYRILLEENGKNKSIEELNQIVEVYNTEINRLLKINNEGTCEIWVPVSNRYIEDEINKIKEYIELIKNETDENRKEIYEDIITIIEQSITKYIEEPIFKMYKQELEKIKKDMY